MTLPPIYKTLGCIDPPSNRDQAVAVTVDDYLAATAAAARSFLSTHSPGDLLDPAKCVQAVDAHRSDFVRRADYEAAMAHALAAGNRVATLEQALRDALPMAQAGAKALEEAWARGDALEKRVKELEAALAARGEAST